MLLPRPQLLHRPSRPNPPFARFAGRLLVPFASVFLQPLTPVTRPCIFIDAAPRVLPGQDAFLAVHLLHPILAPCKSSAACESKWCHLAEEPHRTTSTQPWEKCRGVNSHLRTEKEPCILDARASSFLFPFSQRAPTRGLTSRFSSNAKWPLTTWQCHILIGAFYAWDVYESDATNRLFRSTVGGSM